MCTTTAHRFRLLITAGTIVLAFAIGAPLALGDPPSQSRIRDRLGEIGAWAVPATSKEMPRVSESRQTSVREKLGEIGAWAVSSGPMGENATGQHGSRPTVLRPDDRAGIRGPATRTALSQPASIDDHGTFNWRDATIGAAVALGLMLLALSVALVVVRRRRAGHLVGELSA